MVVLHVKKGDESLFLYETTVEIPVEQLISELVPIFNGRLKVSRVCTEIEELAEHGITMPPNMQGLTDEQVEDLKLKDEWADKCEPSGGHVYKRDDIGRRNGRAPNDKMQEVLKKTVKEAKDMISKKQVQANVSLTLAKVQEAVDILRGAVTIVYPMGLPPHDPIRLELENQEDLSGMQASQEVIPDESAAALWWASKEMQRGKLLKDHIGKNEKTKIICKLQKKGQGAPAREPVVNEDEQKKMMQYYYRKQEEFKKLQEDSDDTYMDSGWANSSSLKQSMHGIGGIKFRPGGPL